MAGEDKIPALIKIDVEGLELEVLEGGLQTIKVSKPIMIIESFPPKQERVVKALGKIDIDFMMLTDCLLFKIRHLTYLPGNWTDL